METTSDGANVRFPPPLVYVAGLALGVMGPRLWKLPLLGLAPVVRNTAGTTFALAGLIISFAGVGLFVRQRTAIIPYKPASRLVTSGIYRWTRNPMYLGLAVTYVGLAIVLNSLAALILLPVVLAIIQLQVITREEAYLERAFGGEFVAYKSRVRPWI
jgi:protein-S-isoprenylcysteine O-methyltransferase Ste14